MGNAQLYVSCRLYGSCLLALALLLSGVFLPVSSAQAQPLLAAPTITPCCGSGWEVGQSGSLDFTAAGGKPGYTFTVSGSVPGLSFSSLTRSPLTLSGRPTAAGSYPLTVTVRDADGLSTSTSGTLVVAKATPSVSILSVTSTHPSGTTYMANYPITVVVQFNGYAPTAPTAEMLVIGQTTTDPAVAAGITPQCTASLDPDTNRHECDLLYTASGGGNITAFYPGDANYNPFISPTAAFAGNPITVAPFSVTPSLSAGRTHTCFMASTGALSCWGYPDSYQSGVQGPYVQVSAGGYHTCMIKLDGKLECWGDTQDISVYPDTAGRRFVALSSGNDFSCAIDTRARLRCWGMRPAGVPAIATGTYKAVSAGSNHVCAIPKDNSAPVCWGLNTSGQASVPGALTGVKAIAAGNTHTCAIKSNDGLVCWGGGGLPAETPTTGSYKSIGSGSDFSCAQRSGAVNSLVCWGSRKPPVDTTTSFNSFAAGFLHTCAWKSAAPRNLLSCWGNNASSQAPRLELLPNIFTPWEDYIARGALWSKTYSGSGGAPDYTISLESAPTGMTLAANGALSWQTNASTTLGEHNFSLKLSENGAASALPLELAPLTQSYTLHVKSPLTTTTISSISDSTVLQGEPITVNVLVTRDATLPTPPLSGTVTVRGGDGAAEHATSCQSAVSSTDGTASCTLFFAYAGEMTITAEYSGSDFYAGDTSDGSAVTIEPVTITAQISAGKQFNCALDTGGTPYCWGKNDAGQGTPSVSVYNQLSAGDGFTCGRSLNASVYCWGWDGYGLGNPPGGAVYQKVTSGSRHACGLTWWGMVACWGYTGDGRTAGPVGLFIDISAGDNHTCALTIIGTVTCWGVSTGGRTSPPESTVFKQISAGGDFTCGITSTDELACWGGSGGLEGIQSVPGGSFTALDAGYSHACALRSDGTVACWGSSSDGKTAAPARTFQSVSAGYDHTCGVRLKTADMATETMECWGNNSLGQAPVIAISPAAIATVDVDSPFSLTLTASGARVGSTYSFSLAPNSTLPAGLSLDATSGLLSGEPTTAGDYTFTVRVLEVGKVPALIAERTYAMRIRSRAALTLSAVTPESRMAGKPITFSLRAAETPGAYFAPAQPSGTVTLTSSDGKGCQIELSAGAGSCTIFFTSGGTKSISASYPGDQRFMPGSMAAQTIEVAAFSQSPRILTAKTHTLIHAADGSLVCFGAGCATGSLSGMFTSIGLREGLTCGLGLDGMVLCSSAITPADVAQAVQDHGPYIGLSVGGAHACAIRLDGTLYCWGANDNGQAAPPTGAFTAVSTGAGHTCGIRAGGVLACWGDVTPLPGGIFSAVSAGGGHSCALRSDGTLACWGSDSSGQVGGAPGAGSFQAVSVGAEHSCALGADGKITCWGSDASGQSSAPYGTFTALASADDHNCALRDGLKLTCWGGTLKPGGEEPQIKITPLVTKEITALRYWEHSFNPTEGTKPYTGSVVSGSLPQGIELKNIDLSPAGVKLYGTPTIPGDYAFVLRWEDNGARAGNIPLVLEMPYQLRVTGTDLAVSIKPAGSAALVDNDFSFAYTIRTLSALTTPAVQVAIEVPAGLANVTYSGLDDCALDGLHLVCTLTNLAPGPGATLIVRGKVSVGVGEELLTSALVTSTQAEWPEVAAGNNAAASTVPVSDQAPIFEDDFSGTEPKDNWTGGGIITAPGEVTYLGDFASDQALRLVINDIAPHKWVQVSFDLYIIGPWQGSEGPSTWTLSETGQAARINTSFCNQAGCTQAYPGSYPGGANPPWAGAAGRDELGFPGVTDTRYRITLRFEHESGTLDLSMLGAGLPPGAVWGLDNVKVVIGAGQKQFFLPMVWN